MINVPCSTHIKCHEGILIYYHQKVHYINNVQLTLFAVNKYDLLGSKSLRLDLVNLSSLILIRHVDL
ncbi:hypothetical protein Hanom_Chr06g00569121 [Helianthus anomalus]